MKEKEEEEEDIRRHLVFFCFIEVLTLCAILTDIYSSSVHSINSPVVSLWKEKKRIEIEFWLNIDMTKVCFSLSSYICICSLLFFYLDPFLAILSRMISCITFSELLTKNNVILFFFSCNWKFSVCVNISQSEKKGRKTFLNMFVSMSSILLNIDIPFRQYKFI